jgi:peptidoglycan-associated lipoprotein
MMMRTASFKMAVVFCSVLALSACSKKNQPSLDPNAGLDGAAGRAAPGSQEEFKTVVGDRIYFLVDQSTLTPEGEATLTSQAQWLQKYPGVTIQMEGHADERGTREYNISLSARRATAAREYLIQQGVPAGRVASIAYGKERPVALCDEEQCWSQNRRAVTVITGGAN